MGYQGYVTSRPFRGNRVPQHVQNIVIRDYCRTRGLQYHLSGTEYAISGSSLMFNQMINNLANLDGIILYSLYQLPLQKSARFAGYDGVLKNGKSLIFANETLKLAVDDDVERIEDILNLTELLNRTPNIQELI